MLAARKQGASDDNCSQATKLASTYLVCANRWLDCFLLRDFQQEHTFVFILGLQVCHHCRVQGTLVRSAAGDFNHRAVNERLVCQRVLISLI